MTKLSGTIDEWKFNLDRGVWYREDHPEDGEINTSIPFPQYWQRRIDQDLAVVAKDNRRTAFVGDISRQEFLDHLKTDSPAEIENFVRNRINADDVTNLASAQQCLKRMETGFVVLMKLLALHVRA